MLGSQNLVLATAMAVSTTAIILAFSRLKSNPAPPKQPLPSCLSSPESKKRRGKKKVQFAENVEEAELKRKISCQREMDGMMPPNQMTLYNGILKDRSQQRVQCSH